MTLIMRHWKESLGDDELQSEWRIATQDGGDAIFPSDSRLRALFRRYVPWSGELVVKERGSNYFVAELPADLAQKDREPFLRAVWQETIFK